MSVSLNRLPRMVAGAGASALVIAIAATAASGASPASTSLPQPGGILPGSNAAGVPWGACDPGSADQTCDDYRWAFPNNSQWVGVDNMVNVAVGGDFTVQGSAAESEGLLVVQGHATWSQSVQSYDVGTAGVGSRVTPEDGADFLLVGGDATVARPTGSVRVGTGGVGTDAARFGAIGVAGDDHFRTIEPTGTYGRLGEWTGALHNTLLSDEEAAERVAAYAGLFDAIPAFSQQCYSDLAQTAPVLATQAAAAGNVPALAVPGDFSAEYGTATFAMPTPAGDAKIVTFDMAGTELAALAASTTHEFVGFPADVTVLINLRGDTVNLNAGSASIDGVVLGTGATALPPQVQRILWNIPDATTIGIGGYGQYPGSWLVGNPASTTTMSAPGLNGRLYTAGNLVHTGSGTEFHNYAFTGQLGCVLEETAPSPSSSPSVTASPAATPSVTASPSVEPSVTASPAVTPSVTASPSVEPSVSPSPSTEPSITASPTPSAAPSVSASPSTTPISLPASSPEPEVTTFPTASPEPSVTGTSPTAEASVTPEPTATATTGTAPTPESSAVATSGRGSLSASVSEDTDASSGAESTSGATLPTTGVNDQAWRSAGIAGVMLALGGGLLALARRRA
ncbi:choice-of-anchor A family protein [Demequina globuliformis]|uniref:choice-of-anchor A family protein n=1 Tax=Demequina globuliformis TaxID=676202 RepID=UPI0007816807|nr:choice-of-anchor A family protein [Demequina globuliformis]